VGNQDRKLWGHVSCEISHKEGWTNGNNCNSWSFRPSIFSKRKSQCNCKLLRNPVHAAQSVWHWPWTAGGGSSPSSAHYRRWNPPPLPVKFRPCEVSKEILSLKLGKACGIDGIPNECLRHLPRRSLVHITHLFSHCLRLCHFPAPWKEAKIIALRKPGKNPKFPENLRPISLLSTTGTLLRT
jgi:hypothetical protein